MSFARTSLAPYGAVWAAALAIAAIDAAWLFSSGLALAPGGFLIIGAASSLLAAAGAFWTHVRYEPVLRAMALASGSLVAFTTAAAVLHYLAATLSLPLVDSHLAAFEAILGFDWVAYTAVLREHPRIELALALVYHSSAAQMAAVVIVLSATLRFDRLAAFVPLFAGSLAIVILVSALLPALGPHAFYGTRDLAAEGLRTVGGTWHLAPVTELRRGGMETIALSDMRGLATFPSFHVCLAIITGWALAPVRIIGPLAIALSAMVIVGTVSAGGHYLSDVIAGALLSAALLACRRRISPRGCQKHHAEAFAAAAKPSSRVTRSAVMRAPS